LLLAPQSARAQRGFSLFGSRTTSLYSIAANDVVQKELGLAGDEAAKLRELGEQYRDALTKATASLGIDFGELGDLPQAERNARLRAVSAQTTTITNRLNDEFLPRLTVLLAPAQLERVKQIQLQAQGSEALTTPAVAAALQLTADQQRKLAELATEYQRRQDQLTGDFQQRFARSRELNAERDKRSMELLSADQKAKWNELIGKPFDVSVLRRR
jgi:hypothetical protein